MSRHESDPTGVGQVPPSWSVVHGITMVGLVGIYFFVVYCNVRGMLAIFGTSVAGVLTTIGISLLMSGFLVWMIMFAELPELIHRHWIPTRRARRGLCPACGHDVSATTSSCPECGHDGRTPGAYRFGWATIQRFSLMLLLGWLIGCVVGEWWSWRDESGFRRSVETAGSIEASISSRRHREWPADGFIMAYDPAEGFRSVKLRGWPRIPGWKPRDDL
ncbi:MAG: hypothetical protein CMJ32_02945 [Phycisphaerae bacterium]|nr:hypothetical protein [Phycisphaerae bacterium]